MRFTLSLAAALTFGLAAPALAEGRNIVIFVADGLRYESVTPETAPTMAKLRREGVDFNNSHSTYPTLTTVNAAVIATGHYPGDTGNYANTLYVGQPIPCRQGATIAFIEDDCILKDIKAALPKDYVAQTTLIEAARAAGMNTVVIGKKGPAAIQFLAGLDSKNESVEGPLGLFIDDSTNRPTNPDGSPTKSTMLGKPLGTDIAKVTGGTEAPPLAGTPNIVQQAYLRQAVTQVVIPRLKASGKPFAMLYWSRDPDTTQHGAMDSDGALVPGINSTSGRAAIYNADNDLKGILDALKQQGLDGNTDVFVTADHGFSTVARQLPTPDGGVDGPLYQPGFLAVDIARWLNQKLFTQEHPETAVDLAKPPALGAAFIGPSPAKARATVVGNGALSFVYLPRDKTARATAKAIFAKLVQQPYVGGLFVRDDLFKADKRAFAGALPMSDINMMGSSKMPRPAIVVAFRTFVVGGCSLGEQLCAAELVDSSMHTGQGMHGSFSRADTRNFMAATGPDFKKGYADKLPVGNVDIAPTLAHLIGVNLTGPGTLKGRVIEEALVDGKEPKVTVRTIASEKAAGGVQTLLNIQEVGSVRYLTAGGIPGRMVGLSPK